MFEVTDQLKRLAGLVAIFLAFVASGVVSFSVIGGGFGSVSQDTYKMLQLFVLSGDWVFGENANWFVRTQSFIAPVFTVIGIIEIFTAQFFLRVWQTFKLMRMKDHAILAGLSDETIYLMTSLRTARQPVDVVLVDSKIDRASQVTARRLGVVTIEGDPASEKTLTSAKIDRAQIALSFLPEAVDSLQFVLSANAQINRQQSADVVRHESVDLWVRLQEAGLGSRLSQYFKFAGLSAAAHPRFFSIEEIAARRLLRAHPPDIYADALGQDRIHLAVLGYNSLAIQVIAETLRQSANTGDHKISLTVFAQTPDEATKELRALFPSIDELVDLDVRTITVYSSGLSLLDYGRLPKEASVYVICYEAPEASVNAALSLRRMLLSPPDEFDGINGRRMNAPILVRLSNARGIGELLRSNVDQRSQAESGDNEAREDSEIPDGIFAFGAIEDLLTGDKDDLFVPTLIDPLRERLARALHESYATGQGAPGGEGPGKTKPPALATPGWESLSQEFRESSRQAADHVWSKARSIRLRFSEAGDMDNIAFQSEEHQRLAQLEHNRWLTERLLSGWAFGEKRVDAARRHNLLKPWSELSPTQRSIDEQLANRLSGMLKSVGLGLKRELVIGIVGHRPSPGRPFDETFVRNQLTSKLNELIEGNPDHAPVVLTSLAEGADTIAAEVCLELGIPYWAPLPMPYEAYSQDFLTKETTAGAHGTSSIERFRRLVALSERYLELPLKFGDLTEVSLSKSDVDYPQARINQYALAGGYIVERADTLLAVWDGRPSQGVGGTADIVSWRNAGAIPAEYRTPEVFRLRPEMSQAIIIPPVAHDDIGIGQHIGAVAE